MKRLAPVILLLLMGTAGPLPAINPSDVEAVKVHKKLYEKNEKWLTLGVAHQRVQAALFFGARRNPRYVRVLNRELLKRLDKNSVYLNLPDNDPLIKSMIAWSLGQIRHHKAIPSLVKALEKTNEIIDMESDKIRKLVEAEKQRYEKDSKEYKESLEKAGNFEGVINNRPLYRIIMERDAPGPTLYRGKNGEHEIPYSPDIYWSISDEFKFLVAPPVQDSVARIRIVGFNYVNLAYYLFDAIGEIYYWEKEKWRVKKEHVDAVNAYMTHRFPFIRGAAAISLGKIGSPDARAALKDAFANEKDNEVRVKICHGILMNDKTAVSYYKTVLELLQSDERDVRFAAAITLRDIPFGESGVALKEALKLENIEPIRRVLQEAIKKAYIESLLEVRDSE